MSDKSKQDPIPDVRGDATLEVTTDALLELAVESLVRCGCQFWACKGYNVEPENMITCYRCDTLRTIFAAHRDLHEKYADVKEGEEHMAPTFAPGWFR